MTAPVKVLAPCEGTVQPLSQVPDEVFAQEMVGGGLAIEPGPEHLEVTAPVDGTLVQVRPHAFVVQHGDVGVLTHLGIDTVKLDGEGFEVLAEKGATVTAGQPVVRWDRTTAADRGLSTMVVVCVLDSPAGSVTGPGGGTVVTAGTPLFPLTNDNDAEEADRG